MKDHLILNTKDGNVSGAMRQDVAIEVYKALGGEDNPRIVLVKIVTCMEVPDA